MLSFEMLRKFVKDAPNPVLSLVLRVDPTDRANQSEIPAWQIFVKNALRTIEDSLEQNQHRKWQSLREQVENFVRSYKAKGKTLALYFGEDFAESFELAPVLKNHSSYGLPFVLPLLWAIDEYEPCLVVLVDHEKAQFVNVQLGHADSQERMKLGFENYDYGFSRNIYKQGMGSKAHQGSTKDDFTAMKNAHLNLFYRQVVEQTEEDLKKIGARRLILAGNKDAAQQVKNLIGDGFPAHLLGVLPLPIDSSEKEIAAAIQKLVLNEERSEELDLVNNIIDVAKAGGRVALGLTEVEIALANKQVELLILPYPPMDDVLVSGWVSQALLMGARIELVHGSAAARLRRDGNVAARLYYPIQVTL